MHVNVVMGGQLNEHLLFWQPTISINLCYCTVPCLLFEMEIKYGDDNDDDDQTGGQSLPSHPHAFTSFPSLRVVCCLSPFPLTLS